MSLTGITLVKEGEHRRAHILQPHLYEIPRTGRHWDTRQTVQENMEETLWVPSEMMTMFWN